LVARAMLDGIDDDSVDFRPNYDGEEHEPVVLPGGFPNLLANGAAGIAVGMATSIPPHNAGEVCDAALALIRDPSATTADLLLHMPGPDFPTGGVLVEDASAMAIAYETGRGGFRLRARWAKEELKHGTWQIVVTEIPYQVQKSKLIEVIAELLEAKKLPLLGDVRDESTELVRLVLEPKTRGIDPAALMETLFRTTQLETRFPLNMNVLTADRTPVVLGLRGVLRCWLDHRGEVLIRRSRHRLGAVERRLELLNGFLVVFLDLDEVIRIIREEDDAKAGLIARFGINDVQAEAILNMRLRSLRRLEEMELRREHAALEKEKRGINALLGSESLRWKRVAEEIAAVRKAFGSGPLGDRRTELAGTPAVIDVSFEQAIEREPLTVVLSQKGWIRALRGHAIDGKDLKFKEGDGLRLMLACQSTDRLCLFATSGRAYTLRAGELPRGRGDGQPIRLLAEMTNADDVTTLFVWQEGIRYLLVSANGRGFLAEAADLLAERKGGKQVLNTKPGEEALLCLPADGDHVATVGDNRKLLVFPLDQVPVLGRGSGVILQRFKEGGLKDAKVFRLADGLTWRLGDKTRTETALRDWIGERAQAGRMPPNGFPKSGKFSG
jgi:topoisomerase-4 subunit A